MLILPWVCVQACTHNCCWNKQVVSGKQETKNQQKSQSSWIRQQLWQEISEDRNVEFPFCQEEPKRYILFTKEMASLAKSWDLPVLYTCFLSSDDRIKIFQLPLSLCWARDNAEFSAEPTFKWVSFIAFKKSQSFCALSGFICRTSCSKSYCNNNKWKFRHLSWKMTIFSSQTRASIIKCQNAMTTRLEKETSQKLRFDSDVWVFFLQSISENALPPRIATNKMNISVGQQWR